MNNSNIKNKLVMSDSINKYNELVQDGLIPKGTSNGEFHELGKYRPNNLTEQQKQQAYRLLTEYDEVVIKYAFNKIMFG